MSSLWPKQRRLLPWMSLGVSVVAACSSDRGAPAPRDTTSTETASASRRVSSGLDVGSPPLPVAFRREGGALTAETATFLASVRGADIHVTPRRPARETTRAPLASSVGDELVLRTVEVRRGATAISTDASPHAALAGASVDIHRGAVVEHVSSSSDGVEQSWAFAEEPEGDGDLVVRVRASGEAFAGETTHGVHFSGTSLGLRYGVATWVDARGERTTLLPSFSNGDITITVPSRLLRASRYPAVLDPTITPEAEVDQPIADAPATGDQYGPAVAARPGGNFLTLWYDRRGSRPSYYVARVDNNGGVIDPTGISVATGVGQSRPEIVAGAEGFLVYWAVSYVDGFQTPGVYGVRLDAMGTPIDKAPITIAATSNSQSPSAAYDPAAKRWLVAWQRYGGTTSYDIAAAFVPTVGAPQPLFDVTKEVGTDYQPSVVYTGTDFWIAWRNAAQLRGQRVGLDGKLSGNMVTLATGSTSSLYDPILATDGARLLLTWREYISGAGYDVKGRRLTLAGAAQDAANIAISTGPDYDDRPRVSWNGTHFVVTWYANSNLRAAAVPPTGNPSAAVTLLSSPYLYEYAIASDANGSLVVHRDYTPGTRSDIKALRLNKSSPPGANGAAFVVSKSANAETEPAVAFNGTEHFAAWLDTRESPFAIWGAKLAANGAVVSTTKLIAGAADLSTLGRPRVASDGAGWLVTYYFYKNDGTRGVRAIRVDAAGQPNGNAFDVAVGANGSPETNFDPDVAWDGTNFLVVFQQDAPDGSGILGVRVPPTGNAPLDPEPARLSPVSPGEQRSQPSVAWDGTNFLVAWTQVRPTQGGIEESHIYGSRVTKERSPLDGELAICTAFLLQQAPRVAGDRKTGGFFVVWDDYRTAIAAADIYGGRISSQGEILDGPNGLKIAAGAHDESRPFAAPGDGTNWIVAWRDLRSKESYDIYGAWVSKAGKVFDADGMLLSGESGDEDAPVLSAHGDGKVVLAYQRLDPRVTYGSYRVRTRSIESGAPAGTVCQKGDECSSRVCADGVCCTTECGQCGQCNAQPGTCLPRPKGDESPACNGFRCKGELTCPVKCVTSEDCAANATCDTATGNCISRVECSDEKTLRDLTGKTTDCAPYKCEANACRTQCTSVDDCAPGFVCDPAGRCAFPPAGGDGGGCTTTPTSGPTTSTWLLALGVAAIARACRKRRRAIDNA